MNKKIIALLQARTDSTRLPRKVLMNILNKPMIIHQLERTSKSRLITKLILLTSNEKNDNNLAKVVIENGFNIFRGDKNNVLKRFYDSVKDLNLKDKDIVVRLTGDCPLHDADIIDETIKEYINQNCDYLSNCISPIYPDGLDVEVFNFKSLKLAYTNAELKSELEHVTPYIRNSKILNIKQLTKQKIHPSWRLTVDEKNDFKLITKIYENFNSTDFSFKDTINFLEDNLELLQLNNSTSRNEGYTKSLKEDNMEQGKIYIKKDANSWFDRNSNTHHNCFTEYLLSLFSKKEFRKFKIAEFGVGRGNNINLLSHYVNLIDGYDGSSKSIESLNILNKRNKRIDGKVVNLGGYFESLNKYNLIINGFFTYMINDKEFDILIDNSKKMLEDNGYIFVYDFLSNENTAAIDSHNEELTVYKRNLEYYLSKFKEYQLIDFRLFDNRNLESYLDINFPSNIDLNIDDNDYNWTFCALFKLKEKYNDN